MNDVAATSTAPPDTWWQVGGIWVYVTSLNDPLLRAELHRVTVDWRGGHLRVHVAGNCAGTEWSTTRPDTHDFMTTDGGPL